MVKEFKTLLPYFKKYSLFYAAGFFFLILTNGAQLFIPQLIRIALDDLSSRNTTVIHLALTAFTVALGRVGWRFFIIGASRRIERDLRDKIFHHLTTLSDSFFSRNRTGDLMARSTNDLEAVRMSTGMAFVAFVDGVFLTTTILIILFLTNPWLGFYTFIPLPVITLLILSFGGMVSRLFKNVQEAYSQITNQVQEALSGIRVIQAFVKEQNFSEKFHLKNTEYLQRNLELTKLWGLFFPIIALLSGLTTLILLWYGGGQVMEGHLTPGEFASYLSYLSMLVWPMLGAGMTVNIIQRGAASLGRINEVLQEKPEITSPPEAQAPPPPYVLEVRNLNFHYPKRDNPVIKNISFTLKPGQILGILGSTGVGKTTLLKLLPRLLDPPEGTIFLGGKDIKLWPLVELRKKFAMVPQSTFLFSETIKNNIAFSNPETPLEEILLMGEMTTLTRDVEGFDQGWDTLVGERGVSLSGGQKQRVSLARALTAPAPILLLDDCMASVDMETEEKILGHLLKEAKGRSIILVSHRISTLKNADVILVMEKGTILQRGTHEELLKVEGTYSEIATLQHQKDRISGETIEKK